MRLLILFVLAVAFGVVMYGRRDQSYRMVGTWEAVGVPVPTTVVCKEDGTFEMFIGGSLDATGEYAYRGSTLEVLIPGRHQALADPEWHGEDSYTLNYIHWREPIRFVRVKKG